MGMKGDEKRGRTSQEGNTVQLAFLLWIIEIKYSIQGQFILQTFQNDTIKAGHFNLNKTEQKPLMIY